MANKPTYEELERRVKELERTDLSHSQMKVALRESEDNFWALVGLSPDPIVVIQDDQHHLINHAFTKLFGYTQEDVEDGLTGFKIVQEQDKERVSKRIKNRFAGKSIAPRHDHIDLIAKDSKKKHCEASASLIQYNGRPADLVILRNITDRKQAEEALRESEERFRSLVELTSDWIWEVNQNGIFTYADPKIKDFLGYESKEVVGKPYNYFMTKDSEKMLALFFKNQAEKPRPFSRRNNIQLHKDGRQTMIETSGLPIFDIDGKFVGWRGINTDITERVGVEEMMIQSEKMLSVGGLAAGMAHEINNPLAGILQNVQVMKNRMSGELSKNKTTAEECGTSIEAIESYMEKREMFKMIDSIMESGNRAAKIVDNMLSFCRKGDESFALHALCDLLDKTVELAENDYDLKKNYDFRQIELVEEYDNTTPQVMCEDSKIQQVFLNILKNGAQAMVESRGQMTQEGLRKPEKESIHKFIIRVMPDGEMARVEIEDNGPGMDEKIRKRVFEPFFTTKGVGTGTGLGLSVSYFIITENHGGTLTVESSPGKGAKFIIRLPFERNVH